MPRPLTRAPLLAAVAVLVIVAGLLATFPRPSGAAARPAVPVSDNSGGVEARAARLATAMNATEYRVDALSQRHDRDQVTVWRETKIAAELEQRVGRDERVARSAPTGRKARATLEADRSALAGARARLRSARADAARVTAEAAAAQHRLSDEQRQDVGPVHQVLARKQAQEQAMDTHKEHQAEAMLLAKAAAASADTGQLGNAGTPMPASSNLPAANGALSGTAGADTQGAAAVAAAESQLGVPYIYAAEDPGAGFDCSGLTAWAWAQAGVDLEHYSGAQMQESTPVPLSELEPGDLLFYGPGGSEHVAMYVGNGTMIEAPHAGVTVWLTPLDVTGDFAGAGRP